MPNSSDEAHLDVHVWGLLQGGYHAFFDVRVLTLSQTATHTRNLTWNSQMRMRKSKTTTNKSLKSSNLLHQPSFVLTIWQKWQRSQAIFLWTSLEAMREGDELWHCYSLAESKTILWPVKISSVMSKRLQNIKTWVQPWF